MYLIVISIFLLLKYSYKKLTHRLSTETFKKNIWQYYNL
jgi:hypothetical protein